MTFKFLQIPSILGSGFLFPRGQGFQRVNFTVEFRRKAKALQVAKAAARDIAEAMAQRKAWSFAFFWFGGRWFWKMAIFI